MGIRFIDKMKSIIDLHKKDEWINKEDIKDILKTDFREGFFYWDKAADKEICVSDSSILKALKDAEFWRFIEINSGKSKLSKYGHRIVNSYSDFKIILKPVINDILDNNAINWLKDGDEFTTKILLDKINLLPPKTLPTNYQLWNLLKSENLLKFNEHEFDYKRFRQLLELMGNKGTNDFGEVHTKLYLTSDDKRRLTIRRDMGGKNE